MKENNQEYSLINPEIQSMLTESEIYINAFALKMDEINETVKAIEKTFKAFPTYSLHLTMGECFFKFEDDRLIFSDGHNSKPFIEWDMGTRYGFSDCLMNIVKAMRNDLKNILNINDEEE